MKIAREAKVLLIPITAFAILGIVLYLTFFTGSDSENSVEEETATPT